MPSNKLKIRLKHRHNYIKSKINSYIDEIANLKRDHQFREADTKANEMAHLLDELHETWDKLKAIQ